MKTIYLQTPYKGIYKYLEKSIIDAFKQHNVDILSVPYPYKRKHIQNLIKEHQSDFLFTLVGRGRKELTHLLKYIQIPKVGWFLEDPYFLNETGTLSQQFTITFTVESAAVEFYKSLKSNAAYYMPLGYDPAIYFPQPIEDTEYRSDICLVGYPYPNRISIMEELLKETNWDITVVGGRWASELNKWVKRKRLNCISKWIPPEKVALYYSNTKIILNPHRPFEALNTRGNTNITPISPNNRCFEAAACNTLQVCDYRPGIEMLFSNDNKIPTYKGISDGIDLINRYIVDETKRREKAENAFTTVKGQHTFYHRIKKICQLVQQYL
ncbi:spore maturation protein CgeB [Evansella vedderi]|uniref:Spore maturation protein CgeB n=1 Tax=Evansella vedderi TaxID=38282 RepID=A0ABT9ZVW2_9BACI|nr:glycosyltransferase [Evansella vedderi]MDQ0255373.1 spore maturation protein CgeB [Evansella vedderi]